MNGFNVFNPNEWKASAFEPPLVITDLWAGDSRTGFRLMRREIGGPEPAEIKLSYRNRSLRLRFASLDFTSAEANQYAYKLEPGDSRWNFLGFEHEVSFADLRPGDYLIQVKGTNSDGIWSGRTALIRIRIASSFWNSLVFKVFLFVVVAALLISVWGVRTGWISLRRKKTMDVEAALARYGLSKREMEIVGHIIIGRSNHQIADRLYISEGTVKNHVYNIFQKTGVKNRVQLTNLFRSSVG